MDNLTFILKGTGYVFKPLSGPLEQTPHPKFFADLGYALAAWARMEHLLAVLVIHINKKASSSILHEPDPQSKFSKLLRLYAKWLKKHPSYAHLKTQHDAAFFQGLFQQAELRNVFTHGVVTSYDEITGEFTLAHLKRIGADTWKFREVQYSGQALEKFSDLTNLAHRHFVEVAKAQFEEVEPPQPQSQTL
jgi:hypothetical protein